jgi:4-hydroxy-3-methylbut-2-enyl diphosphate reductase
MEIKLIYPQGFCKGVSKAINKTKQIIQENPNSKIYLLGSLVHNEAINTEIAKRVTIIKENKLEFIQNLKEGIIILPAHGVEKNILEYLNGSNLTTYSCTCVDVLELFSLIQKYIEQNYELLFIGVKGHPEANAALSISPNIHLIETKNDLLVLEKKPYIILSQTTMSVLDTKEIIQTAQEMFPEAFYVNSQCQATFLRQKAILELEGTYDLIIIVGDKMSSNGLRLYQLALTKGKALYVKNLQELLENDLTNIQSVAISSAASTPNYLVEEIVAYLSNTSVK